MTGLRDRCSAIVRARHVCVCGIVLTLLSIAATPAMAGSARITATERLGPRVVKLTISTPAFTTPTHVDVDLPVGYDSQPGRRWPVAYFLAGTQNTYASFNSVVDGLGLTKSFPAIVVSPNGDSGYWSDWYNAGAFGAPMYETYVIDQLIPLIDATFRTIPTRSQRAVAGVSMGGYGAMMFAAQHPDLFADAASLSGAVDSNLPANGAVLSLSPTFQGGPPDAIYGPRATQAIRWHGHNPNDLADNLRSLNLQVRSANGTPNPAIGEKLLSVDTASCVVEAGVYMASTDLHNTLTASHIPHLWHDYGAGCHTPPNFTREIRDTVAVFASEFAHPPPSPASFDYASIEPAFDVWGWHVGTDPRRALEFLRLSHVSAQGLTLAGSGATTVTTPPLFRGLRRVDVTGATSVSAATDHAGRIRFTVDLGAPDTQQQDAPGATTVVRSRSVSFRPYAVVAITRARSSRTGVQACARALGGPVRARMRLAGSRRVNRTPGATVTLTSHSSCRTLRWRHAPGHAAKVTLLVTGSDRFGHSVSTRRTVSVARRA